MEGVKIVVVNNKNCDSFTDCDSEINRSVKIIDFCSLYTLLLYYKNVIKLYLIIQIICSVFLKALFFKSLVILEYSVFI